ncbi:dCTP deaminase [Methanolacinia paynteri]|uniref:dCTP deaminase n=1 Tax=Methanolacinia paynteri TaxID=230356 RepID=UPI00064F7912|nr:dCTP deaminase [Methanolacinia paynteri]
MILVDWQLQDWIRRGFIKIEPSDNSYIQPNSVDIRLGNHFVWYDECDEVIDPYDRESIESHYQEKHADYIDIPPGMFLLAETLETITLPEDVVATIEGKSSIARLGITLHQTGGWIDAGFSGTITLEICNANQRPVRLHAGMPIGQLVFYTTEKAEKPYGAKGDAKYLNQKNATLSRYHQNKH